MLIDEALLSEVLSALDETTLRAVRELFRTQSTLLAAAACDTAGSLSDRAEAAHTLKGLALQFGMASLCETLSILEIACRNSDGSTLEAASGALGDILARSSQELDRFLEIRA